MSELGGQAQALDTAKTAAKVRWQARSWDGDQYDREERAALQRVRSLSTQIEDITEVEYRDLQLEKVVLAGIGTPGNALSAERSLHELAALAETAGAQVLSGLLQSRQHPDLATWLGKGKAQELREIVALEKADTVIADAELAPSQRRALEDIVRVKVIDRTALILDIFAQHAKSREGKAQVELAQLRYLLPRLRGWGESMSRQAGGQAAGGQGMGSRGPGETKIELDRRRIHQRISNLKRELAHMSRVRATKRSGRHSTASVVIVGYTNAGKSSLLNRLTGAGVLVENQLFATLDATVRRNKTAAGRAYTLTDTVGFVRDLPHDLVEAFRSTLEEVAEADLLLHIVDASHPDPLSQISTVNEVIRDVFDQANKPLCPEILVLNKTDLATASTLQALQNRYPEAQAISVHTGSGLPELTEKIAARLPTPQERLHIMLPYQEGHLLDRLHNEGIVLSYEHKADGTHIHAKAYPELAAKLAPYSYH